MHELAKGTQYMSRARLTNSSYLVTVTPEEVLGTDVLVGILGLLLARSVVGHMLPVSVPSQLGVHACDDKAGDSDAIASSVFNVSKIALVSLHMCHAATPLPVGYKIPCGIQWYSLNYV